MRTQILNCCAQTSSQPNQHLAPTDPAPDFDWHGEPPPEQREEVREAKAGRGKDEAEEAKKAAEAEEEKEAVGGREAEEASSSAAQAVAEEEKQAEAENECRLFDEGHRAAIMQVEAEKQKAEDEAKKKAEAEVEAKVEGVRSWPA